MLIMKGTPMMVKKKGLLTAGALAVAASLALAGCSAGAESGGSTTDADSSTLTVWVDADRAAVLKDASPRNPASR
jgi:arabinogalactan oligomer/maltooligosaccharide transport system substrate-binding protein